MRCWQKCVEFASKKGLLSSRLCFVPMPELTRGDRLRMTQVIRSMIPLNSIVSGRNDD